MNPPTTPCGAHDFDFFPGNLQVSHCRLNAALGNELGDDFHARGVSACTAAGMRMAC